MLREGFVCGVNEKKIQRQFIAGSRKPDQSQNWRIGNSYGRCNEKLKGFASRKQGNSESVDKQNQKPTTLFQAGRNAAIVEAFFQPEFESTQCSSDAKNVDTWPGNVEGVYVHIARPWECTLSCRRTREIKDFAIQRMRTGQGSCFTKVVYMTGGR